MAKAKLKIIDAHAHIGQHKPGSSPNNLVKFMERAGIAKSAVFAATLGKGVSNEELISAIAPYGRKLFGVGTHSPDKPQFQSSLAQMDRWLTSGDIRAIKFYTGYEHFYPADMRIRPYLDLLVKHKRPAIFHMGDTVCGQEQAKLKYAHPLGVDDLATEMPDLNIVIAHLGSPWIDDCAQVCYKNRNVYADCSGFVYENFTARHVKRFGEMWERFDFITESSGKILFGTDWPISNHASYVAVVQRLAGKHREAVFHGNAENLFGL